MSFKKITYSALPSWLARLDFLGLFEKDPFGNYLVIKRILIFILGWFTYYRYTAVNKIRITGTEHLADLPDQGVLFLSNHQTYFADVIAFFHIFCAVKWGYKDTISPPFYLFSPRARMYYVAAAETMKGGLLPKIFSMGGAITIERSWRANGEDVKRQLDTSAQDRIGEGLHHGWVVSFPQGTTKPYAPVRKGTAHLINDQHPIVIPVVINGFRRAFDKKGLRFKKRNTKLTVQFKPPMHFGQDESVEEMVARVTRAIEQEAPGVDTPGVDTPGVDTPRVDTPRVDTPRVDTPRVDTPRVDTPRVDTPRVDTPRVDTPRVDTPGVDTPGESINPEI